MPSSIKFYTQTIADFKRLQSTLYDKNAQVGAETKATTYKALGNDISTVSNLSFAVDKANRYVTAGTDASSKIDSVFNAVGDMLTTAQNLKKSLILENSSSANVNDLKSAAKSALDSIQAALNAKDGSLYMFGGSKTDVQPVSDLNVNSNYIGGQPTANYYNGDAFKFSVGVNSTLNVEYGVTADDPVFKNLIAAMNIAKNVEGNGGNLQDASNLLDKAIDGLTSMRATLGDKQSTIKQTVELQQKAKDVMSQNLGEINSPDTVSLSIEIASLQASLQATFQNFSTISGLKLINFL